MNTQFTRPLATLSPELIARFAAIVGEKYAITDPVDQEPYLIEGRGLYRGSTPLVLRPGSVAEVAAIGKRADQTRTPITPQSRKTEVTVSTVSLKIAATSANAIRRADVLSPVTPRSRTPAC